MSLLKEVKKVTIKRETGIISFVNEEGNSTHVLYFQKPHLVKEQDYRELLESIEVRFKVKEK